MNILDGSDLYEWSPGIWRDMPADAYHKINVASSHRLGVLKHSPAKLKWETEHPPERTRVIGSKDALEFGDALHGFLIQPEEIGKFYDLFPFDDMRTSGAKQWVSALPMGLSALRQEAWDKINSIYSAVVAHAEARFMLHPDNSPFREISLFFERDGVKCKARFDLICSSLRCIVDIKTCQDCSPAEFQNDINNFDYHRQAAFYLDAAKICGVEVDAFAIIAVEKAAPHFVAVHPMEQISIELGRDENQLLLQLHKQCEESNVWPAFPGVQKPIGLPEWRIRRAMKANN